MRISLDKGAFAPERAHPTDAGLDLRSPISIVVHAHDSVNIDTGVHVEIPNNNCGLVVSKSGLNCKFSILSTGLIDEGYDGQIRVKLYNHGDTDYFVDRGDKISQLVVLPVNYVDVELVDSIEGKERGSNGFGSTGR